MWLFGAAGGTLVVLSGALNGGAAAATLDRIAPILLFLLGITIVAELADRAGVFEVAARAAARLAGGRVWRLWLLVVALATFATIFLSLDTTAVLLAPVVLAMARQLGLPVKLFAFTTAWLAGTASMLLPVSNLTNLLAVDRLHEYGVDAREYVGHSWRPAVAAVLLTVGVLAVLFRRDLARRYVVPAAPGVPDKVLFWGSATVCLALSPAFAAGIQAAWPASIGAAALLILFAVRRRKDLAWSPLPWRLTVGLTGLFLVTAAITQHGLGELLGELAGIGSGFGAEVRLAATGSLAANGIDNLPAYLALEPVAASHTDRSLALLIGTNCGCLLTPWGSIATLLWRERCRRAGVAISWWSFLWRGLILLPIVIAGAVAAI